MMELKNAVAICEAEKKSAANERRPVRKRIEERPGPNGSTLWYNVDGEAPVNLIWSSTDLRREVTYRTTPSIMDRATS
jgi:hypothetical protein